MLNEWGLWFESNQDRIIWSPSNNLWYHFQNKSICFRFWMIPLFYRHTIANKTNWVSNLLILSYCCEITISKKLSSICWYSYASMSKYYRFRQLNGDWNCIGHYKISKGEQLCLREEKRISQTYLMWFTNLHQTLINSKVFSLTKNPSNLKCKEYIFFACYFFTINNCVLRE